MLSSVSQLNLQKSTRAFRAFKTNHCCRRLRAWCRKGCMVYSLRLSPLRLPWPMCRWNASSCLCGWHMMCSDHCWFPFPGERWQRPSRKRWLNWIVVFRAHCWVRISLNQAMWAGSRCASRFYVWKQKYKLKLSLFEVCKQFTSYNCPTRSAWYASTAHLAVDESKSALSIAVSFCKLRSDKVPSRWALRWTQNSKDNRKYRKLAAVSFRRHQCSYSTFQECRVKDPRICRVSYSLFRTLNSELRSTAFPRTRWWRRKFPF